MKNLKFIVIVLIAILEFSSCSKAPDNIIEKKLVKINWVKNETIKVFNASFEYSQEGKLISMNEEMFNYDDNSLIILSYTYAWNENSIDVIEDGIIKKLNDSTENKLTRKYTLTLENNRFAKVVYNGEEQEEYNYTYDSEGRLKHFENVISDATYEWDGDKLMSVESNNLTSSKSHKFTYGNISCVKGYNPKITLILAAEVLTIAHPELAGMKITQCIQSEDIHYYGDEQSYSYKYNYEFDKEGYITKIIETETNVKTPAINTYTLTWE